MKKEILIAIVIGFILGLVITFGIWTANKSLQEGSRNSQTEVDETQPIENKTASDEEKIPLTIYSPENNSLLDQETVEINGKSSPQAMIAILYEEGEDITQADGQGEFTQEITLDAGANEITIKAFSQDGQEASQILDLVYSTAEI